ncbi:MAG: hypothetical protein ACTSXD_08470 [Candidatus Heimdallarchaeaceae archaeon]
MGKKVKYCFRCNDIVRYNCRYPNSRTRSKFKVPYCMRAIFCRSCWNILTRRSNEKELDSIIRKYLAQNKKKGAMRHIT